MTGYFIFASLFIEGIWDEKVNMSIIIIIIIIIIIGVQPHETQQKNSII